MVTLKLNMVLYVLCLFIVLAFDGKNLVFKEKVYSFYFVREGSIQITTVKIC
jgi:flagellar biosynthesis protein FliR